jgi:DGQHR domain-containing protein
MEFITIKGTNLNTTVYRGFALIKDIATISAPDTFNQDKNREGLQRDLSEKHARDGYRYAEGSREVPDFPRMWPEVVLNVRDKGVIKITPVDQRYGLYRIVVDEKKIDKNLLRPQISRTDGNHRLYYGIGDPEYDWPPLEVSTPFSIAVGLSAEQEAAIFVDINDNQKAMNTSHLAHLKSRLTAPERLASEDPALWIANKLAEDPKSPFHGIVYLGGEKEKFQGFARRVNLAALRTGAEMILKESVKLRSFPPDIFPKYAIIRTFWSAVSKTFPQEWGDSRRYLLLRGFGIWSMSILGAEIIDRCVTRNVSAGSLEEEMMSYLRQARLQVDWDAAEGNVSGYGGRVGARQLADKMKLSLSDAHFDVARMAEDLRSTL